MPYSQPNRANYMCIQTRLAYAPRGSAYKHVRLMASPLAGSTKPDILQGLIKPAILQQSTKPDILQGSSKPATLQNSTKPDILREFKLIYA